MAVTGHESVQSRSLTVDKITYTEEKIATGHEMGKSGIPLKIAVHHLTQ